MREITNSHTCSPTQAGQDGDSQSFVVAMTELMTFGLDATLAGFVDTRGSLKVLIGILNDSPPCPRSGERSLHLLFVSICEKRLALRDRLADFYMSMATDQDLVSDCRISLQYIGDLLVGGELSEEWPGLSSRAPADLTVDTDAMHTGMHPQQVDGMSGINGALFGLVNRFSYLELRGRVRTIQAKLACFELEIYHRLLPVAIDIDDRFDIKPAKDRLSEIAGMLHALTEMAVAQEWENVPVSALELHIGDIGSLVNELLTCFSAKGESRVLVDTLDRIESACSAVDDLLQRTIQVQ